MGASEQSNLAQSALLKTGNSKTPAKIRHAELDLLQNGAWNNNISGLAPALLVGMPQWSDDCLLRITDLTEGAAQTYDFGNEHASTVYEIERIALPQTGQEHYRAVHRAPGVRTIEDVPADGNCFFASVLSVLGEAGRQHLAIDAADNPAQIAQLRGMLARHLVEYHSDYEDFVEEVLPEPVSEPSFIEAHPAIPNSYRLQIKGMRWYMSVLGHLSMEEMDRLDQVERTAFPEASRGIVEDLAAPFLDFMGGPEGDEIQAKVLGHFLMGVEAAYETYQIWPVDLAGRVFESLAHVVGQTTSSVQRDAVMAAYQDIGSTYDRSPLFQHVVQYRAGRLEPDLHALLTDDGARSALSRVLDLADRYGDVAVPMIVARLHAQPQDSSIAAVLEAVADEAAERRIEAVATLREDFIAQGDPVRTMLVRRLLEARPDQSIDAIYDELASGGVRRNLERDLGRRGLDGGADWAAEGAELDRLVSEAILQGPSQERIAKLRTPNAVAGAVAGLYALSQAGLTPAQLLPHFRGRESPASDPFASDERATVARLAGTSAQSGAADQGGRDWLRFPSASAEPSYGLVGADMQSPSYRNMFMAGGLTGVAAVVGWFGAEYFWPSEASQQPAALPDAHAQSVPSTPPPDPIDSLELREEDLVLFKALEHIPAGSASSSPTIWEAALKLVSEMGPSDALIPVEELLELPQAHDALAQFSQSIGVITPSETSTQRLDDLNRYRLATRALAQGAQPRGRRSPAEGISAEEVNHPVADNFAASKGAADGCLTRPAAEQETPLPSETLAHRAARRVVRAAELVLHQRAPGSVVTLAKDTDGEREVFNVTTASPALPKNPPFARDWNPGRTRLGSFQSGRRGKQCGFFRQNGRGGRAHIAKDGRVSIDDILDPSLRDIPDRQRVDFVVMLIDVFAASYRNDKEYKYKVRFNFDKKKLAAKLKKNHDFKNAFHSLAKIPHEEITPEVAMNFLGMLSGYLRDKYASDVDIPDLESKKNPENEKRKFRKLFRRTVADRAKKDGISISDGVLDFAASVLCSLPQKHQKTSLAEPSARPLLVPPLTTSPGPRPRSTPDAHAVNLTVNPSESAPAQVPIKIGEALAVTGAILIFVGSAALAKGTITAEQSAALGTLGNAAGTAGATVLAVFMPGADTAAGAVSTAGIFYSDMINRWVESGKVPKDFVKHAAVVELGGTFVLISIGARQGYQGVKELANDPSWKKGLLSAGVIIATFGTALTAAPAMSVLKGFNVDGVRYGVFKYIPDFPLGVNEPGEGLVATGLGMMFTADLMPENKKKENATIDKKEVPKADGYSGGNASNTNSDSSFLTYVINLFKYYNPNPTITKDSSRDR